MMQDQSAAMPISNNLTADEDERNRSAMAQTILMMMSAALLVFTIPIVWGTLSGAFEVEDSLLILSIDGLIIGSWWLSRRGYWRPGSYLAPALMFMLGLYGSYFVGLATSFVLYYAIA